MGRDIYIYTNKIKLEKSKVPSQWTFCKDNPHMSMLKLDIFFHLREGWDIASLMPACWQQRGLCTYVDHPVVIAPPQGMQHRRFIEVSQRRHVFHHFKLWRIHLLNFILLDTQMLQRAEKCKIYSPTASVRIHFCQALGRVFKELRKRCLIRGWSQRKLSQPVSSKKQMFLLLMFSPCPKIKSLKGLWLNQNILTCSALILWLPKPVAPH